VSTCVQHAHALLWQWVKVVGKAARTAGKVGVQVSTRLCSGERVVGETVRWVRVKCAVVKEMVR